MKTDTQLERALKVTELLHQMNQICRRHVTSSDIQRLLPEIMFCTDDRFSQPKDESDDLAVRIKVLARRDVPRDVHDALGILKKVRNTWAHQQPISKSMCEDAFTAAESVCSWLGEHNAAEEIGRLRNAPGRSQAAKLKQRLHAAENRLVSSDSQKAEFERRWRDAEIKLAASGSQIELLTPRLLDAQDSRTLLRFAARQLRRDWNHWLRPTVQAWRETHERPAGPASDRRAGSVIVVEVGENDQLRRIA